MRWQGNDQDRISAREAQSFFAAVKASFRGRDSALGASR